MTGDCSGAETVAEILDGLFGIPGAGRAAHPGIRAAP